MTNATLDQGLKMLRIVEALDEEAGRTFLQDELISEIAMASESLVRPHIPDELNPKSLAGYRRTSELVRVQRICDMVRPGDRVLDIGIGRGYVMTSLFLNTSPSYYCGIDISENFLTQARALGDANGVDRAISPLLLQSATELTPEFVSQHSPDVVLMFEVLEHVPDPAGTLAAIAQSLGPISEADR